MLHGIRHWLPATGTLLLICPLLLGQKGGDDELVEHPLYKHWANCKPGSSVTVVEKTVFPGVEGALPDGRDEKTVTRTLLSVKPDNVVVKIVVTEKDFLGDIEASPTKMTYSAKIKKSHLAAGLHNVEFKKGEDTLTVQGKKITCQTLTGKETKKDGSVLEHKIWASEMVPGGIVKRTQVTKQDGKVIADTTITVKSFKQAE